MTLAPQFTEDWFSSNVPIWVQVLGHLKGQPAIHALEIGSFEGLSARWLLENILTGSGSTLTCIDTFEGSMENSEKQCEKLYERFLHNMSPFLSEGKVIVVRDKSQDHLRCMENKPKYDIVYIDGDHRAKSVLEDAVLSFPMLKVGGILIFDDYLWTGYEDPYMCPKLGIDAFVSVYSDRMNLIYSGYQVYLIKTKE